jgi:hypothetical protein
MTGISGASPNHPKKHMKNANHDMWNARIGALEKSASRMRVALVFSVISNLPLCSQVAPTGETCVSTRDARLHPHRDRMNPQTLRRNNVKRLS